MKKLVALLMVMVMLFTFAACVKDKGNTANSVDNNNIESSTTKENKDNKTDSNEITIDDVKKAKETDVSSFEYEEVEGGISIVSFIGDETIIVIPEKIIGKPVVSIGESAFSNESNIRALRISDSVEKIGNSAFINCKALEVVIFGSSMKFVDEFAFNNCISLDKVVLNNGLENLQALSFGLTAIREIEIPSSVMSIDPSAFTKSFDYERIFIGESGSVTEQYIKEYGEENNFVFQAK